MALTCTSAGVVAAMVIGDTVEVATEVEGMVAAAEGMVVAAAADTIVLVIMWSVSIAH
jgi:hypothetical protein